MPYVIGGACLDVMDKACMVGRGWMNEAWWREVEASGLMAIENHSWDHNHPCLPSPGPLGLVRGDFRAVANPDQAEFELTQAQDYIEARLGRRPRLFCHPFGHVSHFLLKDWLPQRGPSVGLDGAFGDGLDLRELAPLGVTVESVDVATEDQATLVGLRNVEQLGTEGDHVIDERLDGLRHKGLQHMALDRQSQTRHRRKV